jgi:hypothetical protein
MITNRQWLILFSKYLLTPAACLVILIYKEKFLLRILKGMDYSWFCHRKQRVDTPQQREEQYFDVHSVERCIWAKEVSQDISSLNVERSRSFSVHTVLFEQSARAVWWPTSIASILELLSYNDHITCTRTPKLISTLSFLCSISFACFCLKTSVNI